MGGTTDEDTSSPSMAGKERQAAINKTAVDNFIGESMFGMLGQAFGRLGEWAKSHDIPVIAADTPGLAGPDSGAAPYTGPSPSWGPGDIFGGPGASSERGSSARVSARDMQDPRRNLSRMPTGRIEGGRRDVLTEGPQRDRRFSDENFGGPTSASVLQLRGLIRNRITGRIEDTNLGLKKLGGGSKLQTQRWFNTP
jgi:hypothetical protein